jgi:hypothetical protein
MNATIRSPVDVFLNWVLDGHDEVMRYGTYRLVAREPVRLSVGYFDIVERET